MWAPLLGRDKAGAKALRQEGREQAGGQVGEEVLVQGAEASTSTAVQTLLAVVSLSALPALVGLSSLTPGANANLFRKIC